jgi:hypothetical protein
MPQDIELRDKGIIHYIFPVESWSGRIHLCGKLIVFVECGANGLASTLQGLPN